MQNYLIIENNIVTNIVLWDGNLETWIPPNNSIQLIQKDITAKIWEYTTEWELIEKNGRGGIGFIWDGTFLITPDSKPIDNQTK